MKINLKRFLIKNSRLLLLIILFFFFSLTTSTFWSINNWSNINNIIFQQLPFTGLLALCMMLIIIQKGFDLSIGSSIAVISCIAAMMLQAGVMPGIVIVLAVFLGMLIGLINGFFINIVGVPNFVTTFAMQWILKGIALVLLGGSQIYNLGNGFRNLFISHVWTFLVIMIAIDIIVWFLLSRTVFGYQVYAVGRNDLASKLSGISSQKVSINIYLLSGAIVGLTAILYIANLGTAEATIGADFPMTAIAAALIGGQTIEGGSGKVSHAVIGAMIMLVLTNGMIQLGVPSLWQKAMIGLVIMISVIAEQILGKFSKEQKI